MQVCAAEHPVTREMPNGSEAQCWAADLRHGFVELSDEQRSPLAREEISIADEA